VRAEAGIIRAWKRARDLARELHHVIGYLGPIGEDHRSSNVSEERERRRRRVQLEVVLEQFLDDAPAVGRLPVDAHVGRRALDAARYTPTIIGNEPLSKASIERATGRSAGLASKLVEVEEGPRLCDRCSHPGGVSDPVRQDRPSTLARGLLDLVLAVAPVRGDNGRRLLEAQWLCATCYEEAILWDDADL
jgi:hypothetical protein